MERLNLRIPRIGRHLLRPLDRFLSFLSKFIEPKGHSCGLLPGETAPTVLSVPSVAALTLRQFVDRRIEQNLSRDCKKIAAGQGSPAGS
jgi:hypothetical protein